MAYSGMHDDWSRDWRGYSSRAERDADLEQAMCRAEAEREASWYFDRATARQKREFREAVEASVELHGHGSQAHEATINLANSQWRHDTAEARALFERTVAHLVEHGEVSDELDREWTALIDPDRAARLWPECAKTAEAA